jgi:WD40 repeat protein/tRNA A-37 threonylcarbamoyl transferase component Bud32
LDEALELSPESRAAWLDALERQDPETAADLRDLLEPRENRAARILAGAGDLAEHLAGLPEADQSLIGRRFGPYCVRSLLGHGGMGSVWLAERVDGLFARRVALKLVHPALMSMGLAERLSRERAILARLDHPNIARLYDAGVSDDRQPYLALEYVAGTPLGMFSDGRRLGVRERLELFRQVLSAAHYAHAHLVIHRDLKPSNVLVTEEGRVCLLDFGIAKLFSEGVAKETELTLLSGRALSLDYAAPEQIAGAPITIAADIYALGVMLYELLVGQAPYRLPRRSRAALEESILWTDPVPLSRAVVSETAASARGTTGKKLAGTLRGDLDTIVMKALQKSPTERYATVDALAEDIARWLRGEPVLARRHKLVYRAVKFVRRHWVAVAVSTAFIFTLVGGLAATTYEASVANGQRDAALRSQLRSLTQTAAARLRDGDAGVALGIILEVLRRQGVRGADESDALTVFQEARAADSQVLALTAHTDTRAAGWSSVDFSPDGRHILTASRDDTPRIWDAATGHELLALEGSAARPDGAIFSPDGQHILAKSNDNIVRIWSAETRREMLELKGHTDHVWGTAFSPDGSRIVTASWDKTARIWNAVTGQELLRLEHDDKVNTAQFSPDGRRVVTGSHDRVARIWDATTGRQILQLVGHKDNIFAVEFSRDGRHVLTASADNTARIWDAATGRSIVPLTGHNDVLDDASFSPDGQRIVTASEDRTARIWDAVYGRQTATLVHTERVQGAVFSPDGRYVATTSQDHTARVWDASTDRQSLLVLEHPEQASAASFSPDGTRILTASFDGTSVIWEAATGRRLTTMRGHADRVWCTAFSSDGRRIVTGSRDRTARVWDVRTGQEMLQLVGHTSAINSAVFSPDGRRVLTASHDKTVRVWDATTGRQLLQLRFPVEAVSALFSPDGRRIVTAVQDKTVRIWDPETGRELLRLEGHADVVNSAAFSPDGRRVITASDDKTARVWDGTTGRELLQLTGHGDVLSDAEFSPDGRRIVTASRDRSVRMWEAATGRVISLYKGHEDDVRTAAFSPDGGRIVSASFDSTVRVWDARVPSLEQQFAWAEAAQFDELSISARFALGLPALTGREALLPDVGARARLGKREAAESRDPNALARLAETAEEAALDAKTRAERNAHLLDAFGYFAAATLRAESEGWSEGPFRRWRYRRASLARLLARAGMMEQVSESYESVRVRNTPPRVTVWDRLTELAGLQ